MTRKAEELESVQPQYSGKVTSISTLRSSRLRRLVIFLLDMMLAKSATEVLWAQAPEQWDDHEIAELRSLNLPIIRVRPGNYRAMVQAPRRFGQYPLDAEMVAAYYQKNYIARYLG